MTTQTKAPAQLVETAWAGGPGHRAWRRGELRLENGLLTFVDDAGDQFFSVTAKDAQPEFTGFGDPLNRLVIHTPDGEFHVVFWQNPYVIGLFIPKPYAAIRLRQHAKQWKQALKGQVS